jgi:peptidoglycan-associated lipoprotein
MRSIAIRLLFASAVPLACGSDPTPPPAAPGGGTETASVAPDSAGQKAEDKPEDIYRQSQINIDPEILRACGIDQADAYFAFDSANIRPQDHRILGKLAECFTTGALKGREMRLVGHADPRGEAEYNMVLGGRRADSVKSFIVQKGMDGAKLSTTSRGEMDATGTDEAGWSSDRRVDVVLGD